MSILGMTYSWKRPGAAIRDSINQTKTNPPKRFYSGGWQGVTAQFFQSCLPLLHPIYG
jgi:hypothetical protein